jgi:hypothetical protein
MIPYFPTPEASAAVMLILNLDSCTLPARIKGNTVGNAELAGRVEIVGLAVVYAQIMWQR